MNQNNMHNYNTDHTDEEQEPDCLHIWGHNWELKHRSGFGKDATKELERCSHCDLHRSRIVSDQFLPTLTHDWKYYEADKRGKEKANWRASQKYWTQCFVARTIKDRTGEWDFVHHSGETIEKILCDPEFVLEIRNRNSFDDFSDFSYCGEISSDTKNKFVKFKINRNDMNFEIFIVEDEI